MFYRGGQCCIGMYSMLYEGVQCCIGVDSVVQGCIWVYSVA